MLERSAEERKHELEGTLHSALKACSQSALHCNFYAVWKVEVVLKAIYIAIFMRFGKYNSLSCSGQVSAIWP